MNKQARALELGVQAVGHGLLVGTPILVKLLLLCRGKDLIERKVESLSRQRRSSACSCSREATLNHTESLPTRSTSMMTNSAPGRRCLRKLSTPDRRLSSTGRGPCNLNCFLT